MPTSRAKAHRSPLLAVLAAALVTGLVLSTPAPALAGGCFNAIYYTGIFEPAPQKAEGGDTRLVGATDVLTALGKHPDCSAEGGCMTGVNGGRWDQMIINQSPSNVKQAPVSMRLEGMKVEFFDKEDKRQGQPVQFSTQQIAGCFDIGLTKVDSVPYKGGINPSGDVLEQGEHLLGCICLGPKNRSGAGVAQVRVSYAPQVYVADLAAFIKQAGSQGAAKVEVGELRPGQARYYTMNLPQGAQAFSAQAQGAELFWRAPGQGFAPAMDQWQKGVLQKVTKPGVIWLMVRAGKEKAAPVLTVSYKGPELPQTAKTWQIMPAGQPGVRSFAAYVLAGFDQKDIGATKQKETFWKGCCNAPTQP